MFGQQNPNSKYPYSLSALLKLVCKVTSGCCAGHVPTMFFELAQITATGRPDLNRTENGTQIQSGLHIEKYRKILLLWGRQLRVGLIIIIEHRDDTGLNH